MCVSQMLWIDCEKNHNVQTTPAHEKYLVLPVAENKSR